MADKNEIKVPAMLGVRTGDLAPLLAVWRRRNPYLNWTVLVKQALRRELAPLAGKRHAHLIEGKEKVAA